MGGLHPRGYLRRGDDSAGGRHGCGAGAAELVHVGQLPHVPGQDHQWLRGPERGGPGRRADRSGEQRASLVCGVETSVRVASRGTVSSLVLGQQGTLPFSRPVAHARAGSGARPDAEYPWQYAGLVPQSTQHPTNSRV